MTTDAIDVVQLRHTYGERVALDDVTFTVPRGEVFGLLGPNGGGKTTLFKILSTLQPPAVGSVRVFGDPLPAAAAAVRHHLGVVFQHPGVDGMLSVEENVHCHAHLYGMRGAALRARTTEVLERLGLADRRADRVATLSGGLQRRTELAKALVHRPPLLLLDEPSTGLDPGARREFMRYLHQLRETEGTTIVLTTHYMEEAERCDRIALLDRGRLLAADAPGALKARVGGDVVVVQGPDAAALREKVRARFACDPTVVDGVLRIEHPRGHELLRDLVDAFPDDITLVTYGRPTLEDVFIRLTGHRFWSPGDQAGDSEE